jgi:response regulator RpfG family c-di-GMP phosphodiesterase
MDEPARVLFVDDEENILRSLRRLVADEDFEVMLARSGEEGLSILRETDGDIAVIVSDQRMPGLTGVDFLQQVRALAPDAGRILLTGYADISATIDAINKGGAHRYISKPWNDREIVLTIRDAVRSFRLARENRTLSALVNKQNEELKEWNSGLKMRVLEQTASIRQKITELHELNEKLHLNYLSILAAFSGLHELHDREARNHCGNVAVISATVARSAGLSENLIEEIRVAALLHDIGTIGISDSLLHGDVERMTNGELREYRSHSVRGQAAVDSIEDLRPSGVLIRHHHENFDGSGFPDRLAGSDIPLGARIIALADAIDRLVTENRVDNSIEKALHAIRLSLGVRFDPDLFPLFERPVREKYSGQIGTSGMIEIEMTPRELRRGMIVAHEVRSGTGLLLLGSGEYLDDGKIQALKRYYAIDPPSGGIAVLVKKQGK